MAKPKRRERVPGEDKTFSEEVCPPTDSALSEAHFTYFVTRGLKWISDLNGRANSWKLQDIRRMPWWQGDVAMSCVAEIDK